MTGVLAYGADADVAIAAVKALGLRMMADRVEHGEQLPEGVVGLFWLMAWVRCGGCSFAEISVMAGPVASVLLPRVLTESDRVLFWELICAISGNAADRPPALTDFSIRTTRPIGDNYFGEGRPFGFSIGLQPDWEPGMSALVEREFDFLPTVEMTIFAFCNGNDDHRILGELCAYFAEHFTGCVDFGGVLPGAFPQEMQGSVIGAEWHEVEPYSHQVLAKMPGRLVGVPYETADGREWAVHVADSTFMRAWLEHPQFRMVK